MTFIDISIVFVKNMDLKESEANMIKRVHHMLNNQVIAFDEMGNRMPTFQGKFEEVVAKIISHATSETEFFVQGLFLPVSRELFEKKDYYNFIKNRRM